MSNAVYPTLPGLTWPRKREDLWNNDHALTRSGREFTHINWAVPRHQYTLTYAYLREAHFQQLAAFFNSHYGDGDTWLFDDRDDNTATAQQFGTGDAFTTQYQLLRALAGHVEPVYEPKSGLLLYSNGNPAGTNLLQGGGFEADSNADGLADNWQAFYGGTTGTRSYAVSAPGGQIGATSQHVEASNLGTTSSDYVGIKQTAVPVSSLAGGTYCFSVYAQPSTGPALRYYIEWRDGAAVYISSSGNLFTLSAGWNRYQDTGSVPAGAVTADVYVWIEANAGGPGVAAVNFDGAQLIAGTTPTNSAASDMHWALGANGRITFTTPPPSAAVLTWSGGYYWRCRFLQSRMQYAEFLRKLREAKQVEFITRKP